MWGCEVCGAEEELWDDEPCNGVGVGRSHQQRGISTLLLVFRLSSEEEMVLATTLEIVMSEVGERDKQKCRSKVTKWVRTWNG
jgi:hypothetical protein